LPSAGTRQMGKRVKIQLDGWECERCGHRWVPRDMAAEPNGPRVCPKCKSPYWDRPRRTKTKEANG
jgi:predicted Zn-ribbon and HTH transcriptional regulator